MWTMIVTVLLTTSNGAAGGAGASAVVQEFGLFETAALCETAATRYQAKNPTTTSSWTSTRAVTTAVCVQVSQKR